MIAVEDARERILGFFNELEAEDRPISESLGQVLSEDIEGSFDVPPWDNSAMDGYAVRAEDIRDASASEPVTLQVIVRQLRERSRVIAFGAARPCES